MVKRQPKASKFSRSIGMVVFLFASFGFILFRLIVLQIVEAKDYRELAENQYLYQKKLTPIRGEIKVTDKFSQEGYTVATTINKPIVYAVPKDISDPSQASEKLASILGLEAKDILEKISDKSKRYVPLKRQVTPEEEDAVRQAKLSGINLEPENMRFYPEKNFLSHVMGFVGYKGADRAGLYGLERYFEDKLKGAPGYVVQEKDATGIWIFGGKRDLTPAINGNTLILTIDRSIQFHSEKVIKDAVTKNGADSGTVIIMNPKTGGILAMANYPDFDLNEYFRIKDPAMFINKATTGNYEPGSVFKAFTIAAGIDSAKITPETTYIDPGKVVIDGFTIENSDHKAHGLQTMTQVLDESLNTGVIFAKDQVGNAAFAEYLKKFGFGEPTGIELPEAKGNLSNLKGNIAVNYATASFGQGISVTPIQLMQAYTVFANRGKMMKPYLVQAEIDPEGKLTSKVPQEIRQVISEKSASTVSAMLVDVVENGHGKRAGVKGYYIAGKTGTAQVPKKDSKGYEANNNIGTFVGFGPVENPKFLMMVRIDHPRTVQFAESTAAPAFGEIAQYILNYYNIPPSRVVEPKK